MEMVETAIARIRFSGPTSTFLRKLLELLDLGYMVAFCCTHPCESRSGPIFQILDLETQIQDFDHPKHDSDIHIQNFRVQNWIGSTGLSWKPWSSFGSCLFIRSVNSYVLLDETTRLCGQQEKHSAASARKMSLC